METVKMDFSQFRFDKILEPWESPEERRTKRSHSSNLAPLKGILENDPIRSRILKLLIESGDWVPTTELLRVAREIRPIIGAVTIGTILNGLNELISSKLVMSRTSLHSGIEWAEWRINPDLLDSTRFLLRMLERGRLFVPPEERLHDHIQKILDSY